VSFTLDFTRMITRTQVIPLLLEACPSFHNAWGELQRPEEDKFIYVAFGAFTGHLRGLQRRGQTSEFEAVDGMIERLQEEGDIEVRQLAVELAEIIQSTPSE
jgi:hypothetical protein